MFYGAVLIRIKSFRDEITYGCNKLSLNSCVFYILVNKLVE